MKTDSYEECLKLSREFFATKQKTKCYSIKSYHEELDDVHYWDETFSDEQVEALRKLKITYGDEFVHFLDKVLSPEAIYDMAKGEEVLDIDLDNIRYEFLITVHELEPDGSIAHHPVKITLSDEQYIELVALHLFDNNFTVNLLRFRDRNLYNAVMDGADFFYYDSDLSVLEADNPYIPTLDEAKADAELIIKQQGIERISGRRTIFGDAIGDPSMIPFANTILYAK